MGRHHGNQYNGVAELNHNRSGRLLGDLAGFNTQCFAIDFFFNQSFHVFLLTPGGVSSNCFACLKRTQLKRRQYATECRSESGVSIMPAKVNDRISAGVIPGKDMKNPSGISGSAGILLSKAQMGTQVR
jgi:hypothetical protein